MDRLRVLLVAVMLAVAVGVVAAAPAGATGGNQAKARTAQGVARAHGTTSQGKPISLSLHPTGRRVGLNFGFTVTCLNFSNAFNVFTYEDVATMKGRSTPYTTSGGGSRVETRVRFNFRGSSPVFRPTDSGGSLAGDVNIRVAGVIRVLAGTHLRVTGTIQPTARLFQDNSPPVSECSSGEAPITYSAHSGLP